MGIRRVSNHVPGRSVKDQYTVASPADYSVSLAFRELHDAEKVSSCVCRKHRDGDLAGQDGLFDRAGCMFCYRERGDLGTRR